MRDERATETVTAALVAAGIVEQARASEAAAVVARALAPAEGRTAVPLRRRLAEISGYVGAAFVVGAAALFFANEWGSLGHDGQVAVLAGITLVLAAAAVALVAAGGRSAAGPGAGVRRRLSSVVATAASATAGFTLGLLVPSSAPDSAPVLAGALAALAAVLGGYALAPSVLGQAGAAVAAFVAVPAALDLLDVLSPVSFGLTVLALGLVWLALAEAGVWHEEESARVLAVALTVLGAQIPVFGDSSWVGYLATAAVGVGAFAAYVVRPAWPYLAAGVVGLTLVVPEALNDWTSGSLGPAGVLLATGVTLLVAALLGLRLRHEATR